MRVALKNWRDKVARSYLAWEKVMSVGCSPQHSRCTLGDAILTQCSPGGFAQAGHRVALGLGLGSWHGADLSNLCAKGGKGLAACKWGTRVEFRGGSTG